jgi:hypothetical protein
MEENMMDRKYLVLSACVLLSLLVIAAPVAAANNYAVSVSSYGSGPLSSSLSPAKLAVLQGYSTGISKVNVYSGLSTQKLAAISGAKTSGVSASQGSVTAYSSYSSRTATSSMEFSDSVTLTGEIFAFDYAVTFG